MADKPLKKKSKKNPSGHDFPVLAHRIVLQEVPSGVIAMERGADGTFLRFDCECEDALPYCQSMCCSLHGIAVDEDEVDPVCEAFARVSKEPQTKFNLPVINNDEGEPEMVRSCDSWCVALDRGTRACTIYNDRPKTCRDFHCTRGENQRGWRLDLARQMEANE